MGTSTTGLKYRSLSLTGQNTGHHAYERILIILYILRFSHQILLCKKAFRILLRPIREAKRVSHKLKNRFI